VNEIIYKKNAKYYVVLHLLILSLLTIFTACNNYNDINGSKNYSSTENDIKVIFSSNNCFPIGDLYGSSGKMSLQELFKLPNTLSNLKQFNKDLKSNFDYLELGFQPVEFMSYYNGDSIFAENIEYINQEINISGRKVYVTPLKTIQFGSYFPDLGTIIHDGRGFSEKDFDFSSNDTVPVVLGYKYSNQYKLGDNIEVNYLQKDINLKIIGFLNSNTAITIGQDKIELDTYIIIPFFNTNDNNAENDKDYITFQQRYYLQKNHGYLVYNGSMLEDDKEKIISKLNSEMKIISESNNLDYYIFSEFDLSIKIETP